MLNRVIKSFVYSLLVIVPAITTAQSISSTVHNMSYGGPGTIKASSSGETEICIFCHTPHSAAPESPLWNTKKTAATFNLYTSSTLDAAPGQPSGSSTLCLSCHDGTIALGNVLSRSIPIGFTGALSGKNLYNDLDLSDDHPISFQYDATLAEADGNLSDPASWPPSNPVHLENGHMQCGSCHDAHDNSNGNFLAATLLNSELCSYCHDNSDWSSSAHHTSNFDASSASPSPWLHIDKPYAQVGKNGCLNCHDPHAAAAKEQLLKAMAHENNCLDCHNGQGANTDILTQVQKVSTGGKYHDVIASTTHSSTEPIKGPVNHVECQDCHNPHAANNSTAVAPYVNGPLLGVSGINASDIAVNEIQYSYELCFRCHGSGSGRPSSRISRLLPQDNVILEFATNNPSYHPVEGPGNNSNVPSLISPLTASSVIYCTDCHSSDGTSSPKGPHGSTFTPMLKLQYITDDNTPESATAYALCYSCHNRSSILNNSSFGEHDKHIRGERTPCSVCHDSHGINSGQGNSINNSNLINFDLSIVSPNSQDRLYFEDQGMFRGRCYLTCHGEDHNPLSY